MTDSEFMCGLIRVGDPQEGEMRPKLLEYDIQISGNGPLILTIVGQCEGRCLPEGGQYEAIERFWKYYSGIDDPNPFDLGIQQKGGTCASGTNGCNAQSGLIEVLGQSRRCKESTSCILIDLHQILHELCAHHLIADLRQVD